MKPSTWAKKRADNLTIRRGAAAMSPVVACECAAEVLRAASEAARATGDDAYAEYAATLASVQESLARELRADGAQAARTKARGKKR